MGDASTSNQNECCLEGVFGLHQTSLQKNLNLPLSEVPTERVALTSIRGPSRVSRSLLEVPIE